jgi:hypothetical protein
MVGSHDGGFGPGFGGEGGDEGGPGFGGFGGFGGERVGVGLRVGGFVAVFPVLVFPVLLRAPWILLLFFSYPVFPVRGIGGGFQTRLGNSLAVLLRAL